MSSDHNHPAIPFHAPNEMLADGIELNSTVTHLLLSDNAVTDQGARALAQALCRNRCLSELWLDGAQPPRQGPRVVAPWS